MPNSIPVSEYRLSLSRRVKTHEAPLLRSFFGGEFEDAVFAHNHGPDRTLIHLYPRIQFKLIEFSAILMGIGDGAGVVERLCDELDVDSLGGGKLEVVESDFEKRKETIDVSAEPISYRFLTPWLGLNQKNFRSYTGSRNQGFRKSELSRILVGNCLGLAESLGIRFGGHIDADGRKLTSIKTTVNGNPMIGFIGRFTINLELPEMLGLGKSVSRGFGVVTAA